MSRGGKRKGAGRKNTWSSGCKFEDTKLIRVPNAIALRILEIAHKLDAGVDLELETNSLRLENRKLRGEIETLREQQSASTPLMSDLPLFSWNGRKVGKEDLESLRNRTLRALNMGEQSKAYKRIKRALDEGIESLVGS